MPYRQYHVYDRGDCWELVATSPTEKLTIKKDLVPDLKSAKQYARAAFKSQEQFADADRR